MKKYTKRIDVSGSDLNKIKIFSPRDGLWEVEVMLPTSSAYDDSLPKVLHHVKSELSVKNKIPIGLLSIDRLKKMDIKREGTMLVASISKLEPHRGEPSIRIISAKNPQGIEYEDMQALLDLYPLKENGEAVTLEDIKLLIEKSSLDKNKIIDDAIRLALETTTSERIPVKNTLIAQGRFPDSSINARMEYYIEVKKIKEGLYTGRNKVAKYQKICRKVKSMIGAEPGYNVLGREIPVEKPADFEFYPGENTQPSLNGLEISAVCDGLAFIEATKYPSKKVHTRVSVSVEPVEQVQSENPVRIISNHNLEIMDGLKSGSQVISNGDILVSGKIEDNTTIIAQGNIDIKSDIEGASITGGGRVDIRGDIISSSVFSRRALTVKGRASQSELVGYDLKLEQVECCRLTAASNIEADSIEDKEGGFTTSLTTGFTEQLSEIINENDEVIKIVESNLEICQKILDNKIFSLANNQNASVLRDQFVTELKKDENLDITPAQGENFKELISSVGPCRDLLRNKIRLNKQLKVEVLIRRKLKSMISVASGINSRVSVSMSGICRYIGPTENPLMLVKEDGTIIESNN